MKTLIAGLALVFSVNVIASEHLASHSRKANVTCRTNDITRNLCEAVSYFRACASNRACGERRYLGQNMAGTPYYLGRIETSAVALKNLGLLAGEPREQVEDFANEYSEATVFWARSSNYDFIYLLNEINSQVRKTARYLKSIL